MLTRTRRRGAERRTEDGEGRCARARTVVVTNERVRRRSSAKECSASVQNTNRWRGERLGPCLRRRRVGKFTRRRLLFRRNVRALGDETDGFALVSHLLVALFLAFGGGDDFV